MKPGQTVGEAVNLMTVNHESEALVFAAQLKKADLWIIMKKEIM